MRTQEFMRPGVRHVNDLQSESPLPETLWGAASLAENLEWRRASLSGDDITRQSSDAQMQRVRGPGASSGFGCDITKGLLTTLHPRETTETWV